MKINLKLVWFQGTLESFIVGAGDGHFGLFIDSNLYKVPN